VSFAMRRSACMLRRHHLFNASTIGSRRRGEDGETGPVLLRGNVQVVVDRCMLLHTHVFLIRSLGQQIIDEN
jgi:hypothetical protein